MCGNYGIEGGSLTSPSALIVGEEKDLVLQDRAAESSAELVSFKRRNCGGKKVAGLQLFIAQVFVEPTVERIRSAFERRVYHRWKGVLGAHATGKNFELLNGVGGRSDRGGAQFVLRDIEAVQEPATSEAAASADSQAHSRGPNALAA